MRTETTYDQHPQDREHGPTVLIVDDDSLARKAARMTLEAVDGGARLRILEAASLPEAYGILANTSVHVVLLDKNLGPEPVPADQNGIEAIPEMLQLQPYLQIVMVTGSNDTDDAVKATQYGAADYVTKDTQSELLRARINRAIQFATLKLENRRRELVRDTGETELGGKSGIFLDVLQRADLLAESDRPILITGETGTGKSAIVKRIHDRRARFLKQEKRPFFSVNVTALAPELIENELFGHEKGAFTDAREMKPGLFEMAKDGTLFFDEIGELPLSLQPKLLTVLDDGVFMRVGGKQQLKATPKLIFATNRDLENMVAEGKFREDLYHRIASFTIRMPSLRERTQDIPEIVRALLPRCCKANHTQIRFDEIPADFLDHLCSGAIQGNIRGIQMKIDNLLVYSPRDAKNRPVLSKWRSVPGLYLDKRTQKTILSGRSSIDTPLSYQELMTRPWDFIGPAFPGMSAFLDEVKRRLLDQAKPRLGSNREIARVLRMSESNVSTLFKRKPSAVRAAYGKRAAISEEKSS